VTAIEVLSEEDAYLAAILDDESGLDLAEFLRVDETQPDRVYRAWDFQWPWYRHESTYVISATARAVGKTSGMLNRVIAFPFTHPGEELVIVAPEMNHLNPVTSHVDQMLNSIRLCREMIPKQRGFSRNPHFEVYFTNGSRIVSRLPLKDGRGVKGLHSICIVMDESQDIPSQGWVEIFECLNYDKPGASFRAYGVSRGIRDNFYKFSSGDNPDIPFHVQKWTAMHRPGWGDAERRDKIALYGGTEDHPDYKRNIYGEHGDAANPLFVLSRLMGCVRMSEDKWANEYNEDVYYLLRVNDELLSQGAPVEAFFSPPGSHLDEQYHSYWAGIDVGFTRDPTEILVFGEYATKKDQSDWKLRLLSRIQLQRVGAEDQARMIRCLFDFYGIRLRGMGMDKTGNGLPLYQTLGEGSQTTDVAVAKRIKGYAYTEKRPVEIEQNDNGEDVIITKRIMDLGADELRKLVDSRPARVELPYDKELLQEWQGEQVQYIRDTGISNQITRTYYGSSGGLHTLDAAKMMIVARNLDRIEKMMSASKRVGPVVDRFGFPAYMQ